MRVLLDGRVNGADGIGRYTRSVVRALTGLGQGIDIRVLDPTGTGRYARAEGAELVAYARSCGADIVHLLDYRVPVAPIATISMIITVHDVLRLVQPGFCYSDREFEARFGTQSFSDLTAVVGDLRDVTIFPGRQAPAGRHEEFLGRMLAFAVDQSHAVITPTTTVAHQLCDVIPTAQGKVRVSPWGIDHLPAATDTVPIALLRPYVPYVGQARGHKGLPVLLKAVARSTAYRDGVDLVLVGRDFTPEATAAILMRRACHRRYWMEPSAGSAGADRGGGQEQRGGQSVVGVAGSFVFEVVGQRGAGVGGKVHVPGGAALAPHSADLRLFRCPQPGRAVRGELVSVRQPDDVPDAGCPGLARSPWPSCP